MAERKYAGRFGDTSKTNIDVGSRDDLGFINQCIDNLRDKLEHWAEPVKLEEIIDLLDGHAIVIKAPSLNRFREQIAEFADSKVPYDANNSQELSDMLHQLIVHSLRLSKKAYKMDHKLAERLGITVLA